MKEGYEKLSFVCDFDSYPLIQKAMEGLDAYETETFFWDARVYFYIVIHPKDVDEFNRRLAAPNAADQNN